MFLNSSAFGRRVKLLDNRNSNKRVVFKLGGKSISDGEKAKKLAEKVLLELKTGKQIAVVVSAAGDTTDMLIRYCEKACGEKVSKKDLDEILAMGERTSARLFAATLKAQGANTKFLDPSDIDWPIITDDNFGDANPLESECLPKIRSKLEQLFNENVIPLMPGFIGKTLRGEVTTLGRGGSDTTAFLVAKAIGAGEVIIVTDVAGILYADPKIVPNPKIIERIDAEKLANLCDVGAKFIHKKSLKFLDGSFRVKVTSYKSNKLNEGTIIQGFIHGNDVSRENMAMACITMVAEKSSEIWNILSKALEIIKRNNVAVLALTADPYSLKLYVQDAKAEKAAKILHSKLVSDIRGDFLALAIKRGINKALE